MTASSKSERNVSSGIVKKTVTSEYRTLLRIFTGVCIVASIAVYELLVSLNLLPLFCMPPEWLVFQSESTVAVTLSYVLLLLCVLAQFVSLFAMYKVYGVIQRVPKNCFYVVRYSDPKREGKAKVLNVPNTELLHKRPDAAQLAIRADYTDRLGNHVFQYTYSRLRALHTGVGFESAALGKPFDSLPQRVQKADEAISAVEPFSVSDHERMAHIIAHLRQLCSSHNSITRVDEEKSAQWLSVPVCNYVQNVELFDGYHSAVKSWVAPSLLQALKRSGSAVPQLKPGTVVIHVRLGDILWGVHPSYSPLPMSFYRRCLKQFQGQPATHVHIVTENKSHDIIQRMCEAFTALDLTVSTQSESMEVDFLTLLSAERLILSISTFAWWAAYMGTAEVHYPEFGLFARNQWYPEDGKLITQDLRIVDSRVKLHDMTGMGRWPGLHAVDTLFD